MVTDQGEGTTSRTRGRSGETVEHGLLADPRNQPYPSPDPLLLAGSGRQTVTALATPRPDYRASRPIGHTVPEAMLACSAQFVRLICSLHWISVRCERTAYSCHQPHYRAGRYTTCLDPGADPSTALQRLDNTGRACPGGRYEGVSFQAGPKHKITVIRPP